jgi:hypothetical protein
LRIRPAAADEDPWRAHDPTHPARRADLALITHSGAHPSTILIDVTIAARNSRAADRASLPGCAAEARYAAKATSYARDYRPPPDDVQLPFFSVETSPSLVNFSHLTALPPCLMLLVLYCKSLPLPHLLAS